MFCICIATEATVKTGGEIPPYVVWDKSTLKKCPNLSFDCYNYQSVY